MCDDDDGGPLVDNGHRRALEERGPAQPHARLAWLREQVRRTARGIAIAMGRYAELRRAGVAAVVGGCRWCSMEGTEHGYRDDRPYREWCERTAHTAAMIAAERAELALLLELEAEAAKVAATAPPDPPIRGRKQRGRS